MSTAATVELNRFSGVNRIEIIFGELECTTAGSIITYPWSPMQGQGRMSRSRRGAFYASGSVPLGLTVSELYRDRFTSARI